MLALTFFKTGGEVTSIFWQNCLHINVITTFSNNDNIQTHC